MPSASGPSPSASKSSRHIEHGSAPERSRSSNHTFARPALKPNTPPNTCTRVTPRRRARRPAAYWPTGHGPVRSLPGMPAGRPRCSDIGHKAKRATGENFAPPGPGDRRGPSVRRTRSIVAAQRLRRRDQEQAADDEPEQRDDAEEAGHGRIERDHQSDAEHPAGDRGHQQPHGSGGAWSDAVSGRKRWSSGSNSWSSRPCSTSRYRYSSAGTSTSRPMPTLTSMATIVESAAAASSSVSWPGSRSGLWATAHPSTTHPTAAAEEKRAGPYRFVQTSESVTSPATADAITNTSPQPLVRPS